MTLPTIEPLPAHLTHYGADPALLRDELLGIITKAIEEHPRSLQVKLGPSEVGHPCARRLGYKFLGTPENPGEVNWKATVGTAVHAFLEDVFTAQHPVDGCTRWLTEMQVDAGVLGGQALDGHCDLFDRVTATSVDWKTHGPSILKKYRAKANRGECPDVTYRAQAHIYGLGWKRRGQHVERVALMGMPRDGKLSDAYFWSEPYDEQLALDAIARAEGISIAIAQLGTAALDLLPTADAYCSMCPFYRHRSEDLDLGCPGDPASQRSQAPALTLG